MWNVKTWLLFVIQSLSSDLLINKNLAGISKSCFKLLNARCPFTLWHLFWLVLVNLHLLLGQGQCCVVFFLNGARGSPKKSLNYHVICMHQNEIINSLSKVIQGHLDWSGEAHKAWSNKDLVKVIQGHLICTPVCEGWSLNPQNCSRKFFFHTERKDFQSPLHSCEKKEFLCSHNYSFWTTGIVGNSVTKFLFGSPQISGLDITTQKV